MKTRERATIKSASYGMHEHYSTLTLDIGFEFGGSFQGFGGICLDEKTGPVMVAQICALFGVATLDDLVGRQCFALRCWPSWGEGIEGIEVDGKRWTLTDFRRQHWPDTTTDRLTERTNSIQRDIERKAGEIQRDIGRLRTASDGYIDWSSRPTGGADK